ncbi:hypothetical protein [Pontibacter saemangeumensis]|uniref:hypothetical protein n=1 Tax=Pontibacter saemangeumensis TaxID=1084525 RepID=UPI0031E81FC2
MLKGLAILFVAAVALYWLFYPFLKNTVKRKKLMKWFFIIYAIAAAFSIIGTFFLD